MFTCISFLCLRVKEDNLQWILLLFFPKKKFLALQCPEKTHIPARHATSFGHYHVCSSGFLSTNGSLFAPVCDFWFTNICALRSFYQKETIKNEKIRILSLFFFDHFWSVFWCDQMEFVRVDRFCNLLYCPGMERVVHIVLFFFACLVFFVSYFDTFIFFFCYLSLDMERTYFADGRWCSSPLYADCCRSKFMPCHPNIHLVQSNSSFLTVLCSFVFHLPVVIHWDVPLG